MQYFLLKVDRCASASDQPLLANATPPPHGFA
jgi:hypothetical protein